MPAIAGRRALCSFPRKGGAVPVRETSRRRSRTETGTKPGDEVARRSKGPERERRVRRRRRRKSVGYADYISAADVPDSFMLFTIFLRYPTQSVPHCPGILVPQRLVPYTEPLYTAVYSASLRYPCKPRNDADNRCIQRPCIRRPLRGLGIQRGSQGVSRPCHDPVALLVTVGARLARRVAGVPACGSAALVRRWRRIEKRWVWARWARHKKTVRSDPGRPGSIDDRTDRPTAVRRWPPRIAPSSCDDRIAVAGHGASHRATTGCRSAE